MFKIVACTAALSFAALSPALADAGPGALALVEAQAESPAVAPEKTSDRTPDDPAPQRTPGASITGAAGTEVARTPLGTSDRTPSNHYNPLSH
jgi:hypothetical protein